MVTLPQAEIIAPPAAQTISDLQGVSILLAQFTQPTTATSSKDYSAFVNWGDNSADDSAFSSSPVTIKISGQQIQIFGDHTYAATQPYTATVVLSQNGVTAAEATVTLNPATDVTSQVSVSSTGFLYNRGTKLFGGTLTITNTSGSAIQGSLDLLIENLTTGVTLSKATIVVGTTTYTLTITKTTEGPYVHVPSSLLSQLAPGKSLKIALFLSDPSLIVFSFTPLLFSDVLTS